MPCCLYSAGYVQTQYAVVALANRAQRLLFGAQAPMAALAGLGVSLSIPTMATHESFKGRTTLQKLAGVDYAGAATLVRRQLLCERR